MKSQSGKTILLVEDEALIAMAEKMTLQKHGYTVVTALSGEKAVEKFSQPGAIDLILMDINLGDGMDGIEAARLILREREIPLVFLSSHTEPEVVRKTEAVTSYGYIVKDCAETVLIASIKMAFRLFASRKLAGDTFDYSINGLCIHRAIHDEAGVLVDCEYLRVNAAFEEQTGLSSGTLLGKTIRELYPNDEATEILSLYREALSTGISSRQEVYFPPLEGWFEITVFPTVEDEFTVVLQNISERKHAEQKLRDSEIHFRTLADSGQALVWTSGKDKSCDYFNAPWLAFTGRTLEQEVDNGWTEGVHPEDLQQCIRTYTEAFDRRETFSMVYRLRNAEGEYRWVQDDGTPRFDGAGQFLGYIGHCLDITDLKHAEEALREERLRLTRIMETSPVGIAEVNEHGRIVYANSKAEELLGLTRAEILGRTYNAPQWKATDVHGNPLPDEEQPFAIVKRTGLPAYDVRHAIDRTDGRRVQLSVNGSPIKDTEGRFRGMVATFEDLSELMRSEEARRENAERIRSIFRAAPVGIGVVKDRTLLEVNPRLCAMTGYDAAELLGKNAQVLYPTVEEYNYVGEEKYRQMEEASTGVVETRWVRKDGTIIHILLASTYLDGSDTSKGATFTALDMTELKEAQEKLSGLLREKETMLKETHHRVKNSFAVVESLLSVQLDLAESSETLSAVKNVQNRVTSIRALYEKLLRTGQYSEITVGDYLEDLCRSVLRTYGASERIELSVAFDGAQLKTEIAFLLGAIVAELTSNSLKYAYSPEERGQIELRLLVEEGTGVLELRDDGKGLPPGFDPESTESFGLTLVRMMSEQIGGAFEIRATSGRGTECRVVFPVCASLHPVAMAGPTEAT